MRTEYSLDVLATCPADKRPDVYACTIRAHRCIPVEDILKAVESLKDKLLYQEQLTVELHRELRAEVETVGFHSGVRTRVVVGF